jgi:outer membrane immunogenic protein
MMKKLQAACLSACILSIASSALGADFKPVRYKRVAAVPISDWTGFYIGANVGGSIGVDSTSDAGVLTSPSVTAFGPVGTNVLFDESFRHSPAGAIIGGQVGYNWQIGTYLLGLEADWQGAWQRDTANVDACSSPPLSPSQAWSLSV